MTRVDFEMRHQKIDGRATKRKWDVATHCTGLHGDRVPTLADLKCRRGSAVHEKRIAERCEHLGQPGRDRWWKRTFLRCSAQVWNLHGIGKKSTDVVGGIGGGKGRDRRLGAFGA